MKSQDLQEHKKIIPGLRGLKTNISAKRSIKKNINAIKKLNFTKAY